MKIVRLGDICDFLDSRRVPVEESLRIPGPYPYYGANGQQGWINGYIFDEPLVLLAEDGGHFGSKIQPIAYQISGKTWVNNHAHVLRPRKICNPDYICYILSYYDVTSLVSGTTRPKLTKANAEEIKIPLPPLDEQRRIAAILQRADRLRRLRRLSRQLSDTFLQSVFLQMFGDPATNPMGWKMRPAGDIFEIQLGKMRSEREITGDYLHPYLRNVNVQWGYLDLSDVKEMDFSPKEMSKYLLRKGDILVCEGGEVGRTAVYNGEIENCAYQNALHRLRAKNTGIINTNYFINFMRVACDSGLIAKFSSQVTIAHFTAEKFIDLGVMVPPISTQKEYSQICDRHKIMNIQQIESSRQSEQLFQTLLARAFSEI